jgi:hypothetical protein
MLEFISNLIRKISRTPKPGIDIPDYPVELLLSGKVIGRFDKCGYETPWQSGRVIGLNYETVQWMENITKLSKILNEVEDWGHAESEQAIEKATNELQVGWADKERFDRQLSVRFASGDHFTLGIGYFENGWLEWRNGEPVKAKRLWSGRR